MLRATIAYRLCGEKNVLAGRSSVCYNVRSGRGVSWQYFRSLPLSFSRALEPSPSATASPCYGSEPRAADAACPTRCAAGERSAGRGCVAGTKANRSTKPSFVAPLALKAAKKLPSSRRTATMSPSWSSRQENPGSRTAFALSLATGVRGALRPRSFSPLRPLADGTTATPYARPPT